MSYIRICNENFLKDLYSIQSEKINELLEDNYDTKN